MEHLIPLIAWAGCVCLSFVGYGKALLRLFKVYNISWAVAGCVGISLLVALGGFLEIVSLVRAPVLAGIVLVGDALFVGTSWRACLRFPDLLANIRALGKMNRAIALLLLVLVAFSTVRFFGNLEPRYFNRYDDLTAYLSFPTEMLQLGSLPSDPFSERRIESSLGGSYFLQTLTMVGGDARTIRFIDWGFGSVLYVALVFAICRRLNLSIAVSLALSLLTFVIPLRRLNTTMAVLPAAFFCFLFLLQLATEMDELHIWLRPALMGIAAGAVCTLKSTYLAPAVFICFLYYLGELVTKRPRSVFVQGSICALAAAFCLFPWMVDQKNKEGTYLFPILGRGYQASAYGIIPLPSSLSFYLSRDLWVAIASLAGPFVIAVLFVYIARRHRVQTGWLEATTFFFAITCSVCALGLANGGEAIGRYTMPFVAPGVIVFIAYILRWNGLLHRKPLWLTAAAAFCALWVAAMMVRYGIKERIYREYATDFGLSSSAPDLLVSFDANKEKNRLAALQASVPPGQAILEHLFVSYPLNFRRNPIFIADCPGMAGPPPGMPVGKGSDVLRRYLLAHSIRYVAFSYGRGRLRLEETAPEFTLEELARDPKAGGRHAWVYILNKVAFDAQTSLDLLTKEYAHTYDDGEACVLDLQTPT
jgi:hypothetical protein